MISNINVRLGDNDKLISDFMQIQTKKSSTIKLLIELAITNYGMIDMHKISSKIEEERRKKILQGLT